MYVYRWKLYSFIQLLLDGLALWPIWACSARVRIALDPFTKRQLTGTEIAAWTPSLMLVLLLYIAVAYRSKMYRVPSEIRPWKILVWSAESAMTVCALTVVMTFFSHQFGTGASRIFVLCMGPVTFLFFLATRVASLSCIAVAQRRSPLPRIALVGHSSDVKRFTERMESRSRFSFRGLILPEGVEPGVQQDQIKVLGTTAQIAELVNTERLDSVIIVNGSCPDAELERCNKVFWRMGLPVNSTLTLAEESDTSPSANKLELSTFNGLQVIDVRTARFTGRQDFVKRIFDFTMSLLLLILAAPVMAVVAFCVKFTSAGPILEKAPRVGKGGRHFTCLKFRTTYEDLNKPVNPPREWHIAADEDDHHATPLGRTLRRYSLDELPQFVNILRGEMSLVGPRPLLAHRLGPDGMSTEFVHWSEQRARVYPGLTGLWQVAGRSSLSFERMIELDLEYVKSRSFMLDLSILAETPIAVIRGLGAR